LPEINENSLGGLQEVGESVDQK